MHPQIDIVAGLRAAAICSALMLLAAMFGFLAAASNSPDDEAKERLGQAAICAMGLVLSVFVAFSLAP